MSEHKVAIIMGSPNDRPKMEPAAETLAGFGITTEVAVMSAHRTPAKVAEFVGGARDAGFVAIIAGAGMAARELRGPVTTVMALRSRGQAHPPSDSPPVKGSVWLRTPRVPRSTPARISGCAARGAGRPTA